MKIINSRILLKPLIVFYVLKNFLILDPFVILFNCKTYFVRLNGKIISFLTIKNWYGKIKLGTVYTLPAYRKKGYMDKLLKNVLFKFENIEIVCRDNLENFYKKYGFKKFRDKNIKIKLFNIFLKPIFGYELISMRKKS